MLRIKIKMKSVVYYLIVITIFLFVISEGIGDGPVLAIASVMDNLKIKYVFLAFSIFLCLGLSFNGSVISLPSLFKHEYTNFFKSLISLTLITIVLQCINGFRAFSYYQLAYLYIPLIFAVFVICYAYDNLDSILNLSFIFLIIAFICDNVSYLNISAVKMINFATSYSPFETGNCFLFLCLEVYFLGKFGRKNWKSILSLILTILTFKRLDVIVGIICFAIVPIIKEKKVPRWLFWGTVIFFCLIPFGMELFYSKETAAFLQSRFGIDMFELTMRRSMRAAIALDNRDKIKYGYGSVTHYLSEYFSAKADKFNLHSDVLRIYLDCTILGTILYTFFSFLAVKESIMSYIIMLLFFIEMIFNHPLGAGCVGNWIIIYTIIFSFNLEHYTGNGSISHRDKDDI